MSARNTHFTARVFLMAKYYVVAVLPLFGVENGRPDTWKGFLHCQILQIKVYRKIHEDCILTYRLFFLLCKPLKKISELLQHFFFLYLEFLGRSSWRNSSGTFSIFNFYIHVYMFMRRISMFDELYVLEKQETFQDDPEWAQQRGWLRAIVRSIWPAVVSDTSLLRLLPGKL